MYTDAEILRFAGIFILVVLSGNFYRRCPPYFCR